MGGPALRDTSLTSSRHLLGSGGCHWGPAFRPALVTAPEGMNPVSPLPSRFSSVWATFEPILWGRGVEKRGVAGGDEVKDGLRRGTCSSGWLASFRHPDTEHTTATSRD